MFRRNINQWTLSTHSGNGGGVFAIYVSGYVSYYGRTDSRYTVYPSLYLKSTTKITSGSGTFEEPYIIS